MYYWIYQDFQKEWRWALYAANNSRIAESTVGYRRKEDCEAAIDRVKASTHAVVKEGPALGRAG
jgi:uncharacterized protein YegP (UPF0339 family)